MIHAKTLVVDGRWSVFGSTNLDHRSFSINDEVNVASNDPQLAARFHEDFVHDLAVSKKITYEKVEAPAARSNDFPKDSDGCSNANSEDSESLPTTYISARGSTDVCRSSGLPSYRRTRCGHRRAAGDLRRQAEYLASETAACTPRSERTASCWAMRMAILS